MSRKTADIITYIISFIVIVFLLIGFVGCRSKDTTLKSKSTQNIDIQNNRTQTKSSTSESQKSETEKENIKSKIDTDTNEDTSIIQSIVEYDTSQPIDPNTGKHPVKSETTNIINSNKGSKQRSESDNLSENIKNEQNRSKDELFDVDKSKLKENTSSDIEQTLKTGLNWYEEMSVWIVSALLIVLVIWLIWKFKLKK